MKASLQDRHKNRDHACEFLLTESCDIHQDMVQRCKYSGRINVRQLSIPVFAAIVSEAHPWNVMEERCRW